MACKWIDGFESYNTTADATIKYGGAISTAGMSFQTGRYGGQCLQHDGGGGVGRVLPAQQTWITGFALMFVVVPGSASYAILSFFDGGTRHTDLRFNSGTGQITATRNGTLLGTCSGTYTSGVWYYLEAKVKIDDTTGTVDVRINGSSVLALTGQDTRNGGNATSDQVILGATGLGGSWSVREDDWYINDLSGSAHNGFEGDSRIISLRPSGAGNYAQFTPSTGSNYQNVDERAVNNDTDYNASGTLNQIDSFAIDDVPTILPAPSVVQLNPWAKEDAAGTRSIAPLWRIGGADYVGSNDALTTAYQAFWQVYETNPATGLPWTVADINAAEAGYKLTV